MKDIYFYGLKLCCKAIKELCAFYILNIVISGSSKREKEKMELKRKEGNGVSKL